MSPGHERSRRIITKNVPKVEKQNLHFSQFPPSHPEYRADVDGLCAIAVLAVVAFHAFPHWVKGGFVGVDVFFVISGFLVSTIIVVGLEQSTFSFLEFYGWRIRRIFPALILVLISCYAVGWLLLLAEDHGRLGKHIAAGAVFVSNFASLSEHSYFDSAAETKPLLHLWSLGIEEQFYIIWPLILWAARRRRFNLLTVTVIWAFFRFYSMRLERVRTRPPRFILPRRGFGNYSWVPRSLGFTYIARL